MKKILLIALSLLLIFSLVTVSYAADTVYKAEASWKIEASSDKSTSIGKAFDGDTSTYWHTNYTVGEDGKNIIDPCPHTVTVTFPEALEISGCDTFRNRKQRGMLRFPEHGKRPTSIHLQTARVLRKRQLRPLMLPNQERLSTFQ